MSKPVPTRASSRSRTTTPAPSAATTRATRTRTASKTIPEEPAPAPAKKAAARKPLSKRENVEPPPPSKAKAKAPASKTLKQAIAPDTEREAIMAYLRIRPRIGEEPSTSPYLIPVSDTAVRMTDPQDTQNIRPQYRASIAQPSSTYTFSHIFPPDTTQVDFFTKTTLPLVRDLLQGQNGLLFTYGVTNSGKTYTVQGGSERGTAGILPRTLDVMFNSIDGLQGDGRYRPVRLYGVEPADPTDFKPPQISAEPAMAQVLRSLDDGVEPDFEADPTVVAVDRNFQYTVWLSYAEVYNEKVYDLLASAKDDDMRVDGPAPHAGNNKIPLLTRQALNLRPSPASDNPDSDISGKYISGLRQFRVQSAAQAKSLVKIGQLHRRVFGTLANKESSRSHGMVIIKIMRGHRGEKDDPSALQISRLTLVDLAGSERTKHTHTTGDRLKEAGSINKSLMVLGQCMEVLRSNQRKLAMSLAHEGVGVNGRMDTRDVKRTLAVIPFRHSKMTEALMDYFIGDGRVVMIVNINPYDTGYDENSHIMKFASLAREVYTTPAPAPVQKLPPNFGPGKTKGNKIKEPGPLSLRGSDITPKPFYRRKVTISMGGPGDVGRKVNEAVVEVVEEEEDQPDDNDDDDGDEPANPLVDALFEEIERLRIQLYDAELRCALIEADTREEIMQEMEGHMRSMEQMYSRRLMSEVEYNEMKTDAKIDMLHQAGLFTSPVKRSETLESLSEAEEDDIEMSLVQNSDEDAEMTDATRSRSSSPLARKDKIMSSNPFKNMGTQPAKKSFPTETSMDEDGEELTEIDESDEANDEDEEEVEVDDDEDDDDFKLESQNQSDEDDYVPTSTSKKRTPAKPKAPRQSTSNAANASAKKPSRISNLATEMTASLKLTDSTSRSGPPPKKKPRSSLDTDSEDSDEEAPVAPKRKRQLAKKAIVNVDAVEQVSWEADRLNGQGKIIRRLGK